MPLLPCRRCCPPLLLPRLVELAPHYFDLSNFPDCEAKRELERIIIRMRGGARGATGRP